MRALGPTVLEGRHIRLEPLRARHRPGLLVAAQRLESWGFLSEDLRSPEAMDRFLAQALAAEDAGTEYAFAVVEQGGGTVVGSTRYLDVTPQHRGVEIGWTWYVPGVWGTAVNPEAKLLLLGHAFEAWGALRVCLKTDHRNLHSQAALRKLGARHEGTLRSHRVRQDGSLRDTEMFSILPAEWPAVREALQRRIEAALQGSDPGGLSGGRGAPG